MNAASLNASPYRSWRAATVSARPGGRVLGDRPGAVHAVGDRDADGDHDQGDVVITHTGIACCGFVRADDGFEPVLAACRRSRTVPPAATEPTASRIIGHRHHLRRLVRVGVVAAQRFSPKNVISITRVM